MLFVFLSLIFPILAGWMVVSELLGVDERYGRLTLSALSFGVGFGVFSSLVFLFLLIFGPSQKALIVTEAVTGAGIIVYKARNWRRYPNAKESARAPANAGSGLMRILGLCFYFVLAASLTTTVVLIIKLPHGDWDAWSIWNLKARYIFRSGADWRNAFSGVLQYSHRDYPLLLPLSIAGSWILTGRETLGEAATLSFLFTLAIIVLLASSLGTLRSRGQGYVAGLLLMSSALFIPEGASQLADVPAGFFYLAAAVSVALYHSSTTSDSRLLALAGLAASLAAWTKNEGILFLVAMTTALFLFGYPKASLTMRARRMAPFLAGAIPVVFILGAFKVLVSGAANDILSAESRLQRLLTISRYKETGEAFAASLWGYGGWGISGVVLLAAYLALLGVSVNPKNKATVHTLLGALCIMFAGLLFVFVLTPYDLVWHLHSALPRLLLQMWPMFLLAFFLVARTPEDALASESEEPLQHKAETSVQDGA